MRKTAIGAVLALAATLGLALAANPASAQASSTR